MAGQGKIDAKFWDGVADKYDVFEQVPNFYSRHAVELLTSAAATGPEPKFILDVAAGAGAFALQAGQAFPRASILAVDTSESLLATGRAKALSLGVSNVEFRIMDAQALEVPNSSVDALACMFGFMFFDDKVRAWSEIARVLKPGATAVVSTWHEPGMLRQLEEARARVLGIPYEEWSVGAVSRCLGDAEGVRAQALAAGNFSDVQVSCLLYEFKAFPAAEMQAGIEKWLSWPMVSAIIPDGKSDQFKMALADVLTEFVDDSDTVSMPYQGLITLVKK